VAFKNGKVFKGNFGNEPTLHSMAPGDCAIFKKSALTGSYFEDTGTMRWINGAMFEGVAYRYYLFDRDPGIINPDNLTCVPSMFFDKGILKVPGKPDYVGIVGGKPRWLCEMTVRYQGISDVADATKTAPKTGATSAK
jgi:hypothetical protein